MQNVGAFTLLLLPGAYVALDSGALATLGPWRTLRVCPPLLQEAICLISRNMPSMCWTKLEVKGQGVACMLEALRHGVSTTFHARASICVVGRHNLHIWIIICELIFVVQHKGRHKSSSGPLQCKHCNLH